MLHYNALEVGNLACAPCSSLLCAAPPVKMLLKRGVHCSFLSVGVYCIGNLLQQVCVRKLGAPVFAVFISVRLLASIVGESSPQTCLAFEVVCLLC